MHLLATSKPDHGILSTAKRGEFERHKGLPIALTVYVNVAPQFELQYWDRIIKGRSNPETVDKERVAVRHLRQAVATRSGNFLFFNPIDVFYLQGESKEPAEPPLLINQSGVRKMLSQPLGAAHVRMLRRRGRW